VVLAVSPVAVGSTLARVLNVLPEAQGVDGLDVGARLRLPGVAGSISPIWLAVGLGFACALAAALARWGTRHRPAAATLPLWAGGAQGLSPRMQYTATSFAEPLQRVFDDVLRPDTDIEITHHEQSRYLVTKVNVRSRQTDAIEQRLYGPAVRAVQTWAGWVRLAHRGSVNVYLGYGAIGLLVVLVVAR
jgi:hydrogenase-4 component B